MTAASPYCRMAVLFVVGALLAMLAVAIERLAGKLEGSVLLAPVASLDVWAVLGLPLGALLIERIVVGWDRSSLRRLLSSPSASARSDLAYFAFSLGGGMDVLARVAAFGGLAWVAGLDASRFGLLPLHELPAWAAFPLFWVIASFIGYWEHRTLHTRWLWPLHRSHHSPHEFTIVNTFRAHPLEIAFSVLMNALPLFAVGFSGVQLATFSAIAIVQAAFLHCNWTRCAWLERYGLCTPAGHRLHHGIAAQFHDRNFGEMTNVWDRLFGTYVAPAADVDRVEIGVEASEGRHNTMNPLSEIALQTLDWGLALRGEAGRLIARRVIDRRVVAKVPA